MFQIFDHTEFRTRERELRRAAEHRRRFIESVRGRIASIVGRRSRRPTQTRDRRAA